jgi:hypothetical protein
MKTKLIYKNKWIWGWEDDKEEAWLRQLANEGLHLVKLTWLGVYAFQRGEPRDIVYRMDYYYSSQGDYQNYLQLFRDAGWELVGKFLGWQYFRKPVEHGESPEILTDNESKIKKYQNLMTVVALSAPVSLISIILISQDTLSPFMMLVLAILVLICGFYAFCIAGILRRINQLKRI